MPRLILRYFINDMMRPFFQHFRLFCKHIISSNVFQALEKHHLQCTPGGNANLKDWKKNVTYQCGNITNQSSQALAWKNTSKEVLGVPSEALMSTLTRFPPCLHFLFRHLIYYCDLPQQPLSPQLRQQGPPHAKVLGFLSHSFKSTHSCGPWTQVLQSFPETKSLSNLLTAALI